MEIGIGMRMRIDYEIPVGYETGTMIKVPYSVYIYIYIYGPNSTFSLSTNYHSFPSISLYYTSPTPTASPSNRHSLPSSSVSLALKSGVGLFGSPKNSPIVFSAHFSLFRDNGSVSPVFSLRIKPSIGHFSFHRSTSSNPGANRNFVANVSGLEVKEGHHSALGSDSVSEGKSFVSNEGTSSDFGRKSKPEKTNYVIPHFNEKKFEEKQEFWSPHAFVGKESNVGAGFVGNNGGNSVWEEVKLEPCIRNSDNGVNKSFRSLKNRSFSGFAVRAKTVLPLTKQVAINVQWGVNLPSDASRGMPYLSVKALEIERIEGRNSNSSTNTTGRIEGGLEDMEILKGTWSWMRRDMELILQDNKEMKRCLESMRLGVGERSNLGVISGTGKKDLTSVSLGKNRADAAIQRNPKDQNRGEENRISNTRDLESQLRNAIKSASS